MSEYHKIQSVFLRNPATKHKTFLMGQYSEPAFEYLKDCPWEWTEKIDGTNVRVIWDGQTVRFGGRTDDAQMPVVLMERLQAAFPATLLATVFPDVSEGTEVVLYGEGYGAKIQKAGGLYKPDGVDFILFDVRYGHNYLARESVVDIANKIGIGVVPLVMSAPIAVAIEAVRAGFPSSLGTAPAEGLVGRPATELRDRMGKRVITKIKHRDFQP